MTCPDCSGKRFRMLHVKPRKATTDETSPVFRTCEKCEAGQAFDVEAITMTRAIEGQKATTK